MWFLAFYFFHSLPRRCYFNADALHYFVAQKRFKFGIGDLCEKDAKLVESVASLEIKKLNDRLNFVEKNVQNKKA